MPTFRLLTTGNIPDAALSAYAEILLNSPAAPISDAAMLARFQSAALRVSPYAYALDISGETTIGLIEADPISGDAVGAILSDSDWVSLQGICGE